MACQNIERIYNEIAEKKYPDLAEGKRQAEEGKRQAEEGKRRAEEGKRQAEEGKCRAEEGKKRAEEKINELENKANRSFVNLLQMGVSVQMVSKATGMSEAEVLALLDA